MTTASPQTKTKIRRTQRLIDPRFQVAMAAAVMLMLIALGAFYLVAAQIMTSDRFADLVGRGNVRMSILIGELLFFGGVVALVHQVVVRVTHTVAGPALVLERGLRALSEGRVEDARFGLRDGDYMHSIASLADLTRQRMARQHECVERAIESLEVAKPTKSGVAYALDELRGAFDIPENEERAEEAILVDSDKAA